MHRIKRPAPQQQTISPPDLARAASKFVSQVMLASLLEALKETTGSGESDPLRLAKALAHAVFVWLHAVNVCPLAGRQFTVSGDEVDRFELSGKVEVNLMPALVEVEHHDEGDRHELVIRIPIDVQVAEARPSDMLVLAR